MQNAHTGAKRARLLPKLAMAALISILPLTSTLAQDQQQQMERRLSYNLGTTSNQGTSNLLGWMKSTRLKERSKGLHLVAGKKSSPKSYFMIPVVLNFNSDNAGSYLASYRLADMVLTANVQRPKDMDGVEEYLKKLQPIPKTDALITLDEVTRAGWPLGNLRLDTYAGAKFSADYSYSGIGKYSKQGDTLLFSSPQQSLFALAAVDFLGGLRLSVPWDFPGSGTLNLAPEISYGYRMAWQGHVLVGNKVANAKEVSFLPEQYVRARLSIISLGFSVSFQPEKKTQLFRFLSPMFGVRASSLLYSASSSYTSVQGKGPQILGQRRVELGALTSPGGLLDAGMSATFSALVPQYRIEVFYRSVSEIGLSLSAVFNQPDLFLRQENSYRLTATFGNEKGSVQFLLPLSYNGKDFGIGLGILLGSNMWKDR